MSLKQKLVWQPPLEPSFVAFDALLELLWIGIPGITLVIEPISLSDSHCRCPVGKSGSSGPNSSSSISPLVYVCMSPRLQLPSIIHLALQSPPQTTRP